MEIITILFIGDIKASPFSLSPDVTPTMINKLQKKNTHERDRHHLYRPYMRSHQLKSAKNLFSASMTKGAPVSTKALSSAKINFGRYLFGV